VVECKNLVEDLREIIGMCGFIPLMTPVNAQDMASNESVVLHRDNLTRLKRWCVLNEGASL